MEEIELYSGSEMQKSSLRYASIIRHKKAQGYTCPVCKEKFENIQKYMAHYLKSHSKKESQYKFMNKRFGAKAFTELVKRYVEQTGEKINNEADLVKVVKMFPDEWKQASDEEIHKRSLWQKLPEDFRKNRGINEYSVEQLEGLVTKSGEEKKGQKASLNLVSAEAERLYMSILDYLIMTDDPLYNSIVGIRKKIERIQNASDKEELRKYFESEFGGSHVGSGTAWDYYAKRED